MTLTTVSKKGLTTIPRKVMEELGLDEGDRIIWRIVEEGSRKTANIEPSLNPYKKLKGRRGNPDLTYERIEGLADKIIDEEVVR